MSTLFTLSGCLMYTFTIITVIILVKKLVTAVKEGESRGFKALLIYGIVAVAILGTLIGVLFQNYGNFIA